MKWLCVVAALGLSSAARAQALDTDGDGCRDDRALSEQACAHPSAILDPSTQLGSGVSILPYAVLGPDLHIGERSLVGERANIAGRGLEPGPSVIGADVVIGRRSILGSDVTLADDIIFGRAVRTGTHLESGSNVAVGYAAELGDHVTLGGNATVGNLVMVGDWTEVANNTVLARGVAVDGGTQSSPTQVGGIIGPEVTIGSGAVIGPLVRIRKQATIHAGARIEGTARIGRDAVIGPRAVIEDGAVVRAGVSICNDTVVTSGTYIPRGLSYPAEGCPCEPGFEGPPGACVDIDECATDTDDCGANTECANTVGSFECTCSEGFVRDVVGECAPVGADVTGDFGPDLTHQAPSAMFETSNTVTVDGFEGELDIDVQTTGSGPEAVVEVLQGGSWVQASTVSAGDVLRLRMQSAPSTGSTRTARVTLYVGPTNVWTSRTWTLSTWTYSASGVSYGSCSVPCGGGSRSPVSWSCNRSDGTSGHSQSFCSPGGSISCNTHTCPFNPRVNGNMVTINDPYTNADRYDIQCRIGGAGDQNYYIYANPQVLSSNASSKEVQLRITTGREAYLTVRFAGSSTYYVSSFGATSGRHPYMCANSSTSVSSCSATGNPVDPFNCSSYVFCRVRDRNQGSQNTMYTNRSISGSRAITHCGGGTPSGNYLPPVQWQSW